MTTVAKIRKLYASGRPRKRDQQLSPITAYGQAGTLLERLEQDMTAVNLDPADAVAFLVVNELGQDVTAVLTFRVGRSFIDTMIPKLMAFHNPVPVGVVFSVFDREETDPSKKYKQWASPFLSGPAAITTLQTVLDQIKVEKQMDS